MGASQRGNSPWQGFMQIGMFYQIQVPKPWTAASDHQKYWELLEQVSFAEEQGFTSVWMADHQFRTEWSHSSAPDVTLAALSQRTSKIRLGIAVVVPPVQHPLHIAARTATLDILSNGRVDLGVGRSGYPYQMAAFGAELSDATGMVDEALEIIPKAWTEGEFSYQGRHYQIPPREVHPKPVQQPHPPIWLACSQDDTFHKAGSMGLGCLAMAGGGRERLTKSIDAYRGGINEAKVAGRPAHNRVAAGTVAFCGENRARTMERAAVIMDWYRAQGALRDVKVWQEQDPDNVPEDYRWHYQRSTAEDSPKRNEESSLDLIKQGRYCIGDPDDCIRFLEEYEAAGLDEVIPLFQIGSATHEEVTTLRLFGDYVIPHFQKRAAEAPAAVAQDAPATSD